MNTVDEVLTARAVDPDGLSRMLKWSFGIHFGVVFLALVIPRDWLATDRTQPEIMTISLGAGTPGPQTGGRTSIGARAADRAEPPPPRPTPVTPSTSRPTTAGDSVTLPKPPDAPPRPAAARTQPAVGERVQTGSAAAETGATQDSAGLAFGGGAGQAMVSADFCCPWYFTEMISRIQGLWRPDLPGVRGETVIEYTIKRDGSITDLKILKSSGVMGDIEARKSLQTVRLDPIPSQVEQNEIVIRLTFPYGRDE